MRGDTTERHPNKFRTVYAKQTKPANYQELYSPVPEYSSNRIITSKYKIINFIPKNLFEQFRRIANIYFLINCILIFITPDPPTNPWTNLLPLLIVIIVTMVKQGYEDILRHLADTKVNNLSVRIFREGKFKESRWANIKCGDIVEVTKNQAFPCDLLLLHSNTEDNRCFITTANLDGESNLKSRSVVHGIEAIHGEGDLNVLQAVVQYENSNRNLYAFNGKIIVNNKEYPIVNENILLRGCYLKLSSVIYGMAIYTGKDTKLMQNSKFKSNKLSVIERHLNRFILIFLVTLVAMTLISFGLSFTSVHFYTSHWYLKDTEPPFYETNYPVYLFNVLVHFMNLFNNIVPLSMYVTIELQRFVSSKFIQWDQAMFDEATNMPARANTSDLNEDLGQIEYLFSDKTGTITQNEMAFKRLAVDGSFYREKNGELYEDNSDIPVDFEKDEYSLVCFCKQLGIVYMGDEASKASKKTTRTIDFKGRVRGFELLRVLEFDSTRKRMSVIVRDTSSDEISLYCKGAESSVISKCGEGNLEQCLSDVRKMGELGWRTLVMAYKRMSFDDYKKSIQMLDEAFNNILDREACIARACDRIESDLTMIGSTAVEDKLQDDVTLTLETVRKAGIKVWVLTGDNKETAINISNSCRHFSSSMQHLVISEMTTGSKIEVELIRFRKRMVSGTHAGSQFALTIDGQTLDALFGEGLEDFFREICMRCEAVLCCRMSPNQKAQLVRLVKESSMRPMICAIGDGANDVSMIQEAHVGIGIYGKEGRIAAMSADFAFGQFKFLKRIIIVHGYLYYTRSASMVLLFFYKNLSFVACQFYFSIFNAFSTGSLYDSMILTMYNTVFTAAPTYLFGLFEQKASIPEIEDNPYLYRTIKQNRPLTTKEFLKWNLLSLWHSLVVFFFAYAIYSSSTPFSSDGKLTGSVHFGAYITTLIVFIVHIKLFTEWHYKGYFLLLGYFLSIFNYILYAIIPNSFIMPEALTFLTESQTNTLWIYYNMFSQWFIWLSILPVVVACMIPDVVCLIVSRTLQTLKIQRVKIRDNI